MTKKEKILERKRKEERKRKRKEREKKERKRKTRVILYGRCVGFGDSKFFLAQWRFSETHKKTIN